MPTEVSNIEPEKNLVGIANEDPNKSLPILKKDPNLSIEKWYVLYTKSRQEKIVEKRLKEKGFDAYCPTMLKIRQWSDRKKKVEVPIFNSYCFVRISLKNKNEVFSIDGIVRYVYWLSKPAFAHDKEIEHLKRWLDGVESQFEVQDFTENDRVQIKSGSLINQQGLLLKQSGNQVTLWLPDLGMKVVTSLKDTLLEKI